MKTVQVDRELLKKAATVAWSHNFKELYYELNDALNAAIEDEQALSSGEPEWMQKQRAEDEQQIRMATVRYEAPAAPAQVEGREADFTPGDTYSPTKEVDKWIAGINHLNGAPDGDDWYQRIEIYGDTQEDAEALRDRIINALAALPPSQPEAVAWGVWNNWSKCVAGGIVHKERRLAQAHADALFPVGAHSVVPLYLTPPEAEATRLLRSVLDLQRQHYGDGSGLHVAMIGKADEIEAFLNGEKV